MIAVTVVVLVIVITYLIILPGLSGISAGILIPRRLARLGRNPAFPVNVIVPCYGSSEHLEENLRAIAASDYPNAVTTFVTDTPDDAAMGAINAVVRENPRARHIVSGRAERTSGKNHAQLVAIEADTGSEVFVIMDSDMRPQPGWLREMVRPFLDPGVTVSCSSRWIIPTVRGLAPKMYAALESYRPLMLAAPVVTLLWGGYFAIRRSTFLALGIAELWQNTEDDDLVLCNRLAENGMRPVFVPAAMSPSFEVHRTVASLVRWFSRQGLTGRLHAFVPWLALVASETIICLATAGSLGLLIAQAATAHLNWMALLAPILILLIEANMLLVRLPYRANKGMSPVWWFLLPIPENFIMCYSLWTTAFVKKMQWGSATIVFNKDGTISKQIPEK